MPKRLIARISPRRAGRPVGQAARHPAEVPVRRARLGAVRRICELPEYYLTRTETAILQPMPARSDGAPGPGCALIEFGSGSSVKSRLLIEALAELALYAPIDI